MSSPEYLRFYDDTVVRLAQRGHDVRLAVHAIREGKPVRLDGIEDVPNVSVAGLIPARGDRWTDFARGVRGTMDFVRYLHPRLAPATLLRARMKRQALPWTLQWVDHVRQLPVAAVNRLMRRLEALERAVPASDAVLRFLDVQAPDLVLVSPLVEAASDQVDIVRAAQARGIRVGTLVASWDNLTNKGDLRVATDFVAVWNDAQKREAVELHRLPGQAIAVTGAQAFDRWFDRQPSRSREAFCRDVGLPDDRPFVLFTGSSIFIARAAAEMSFVRRWIEALRASDDRLIRDVHVLVRPHPYNGQAWRADDFAGLAGVAVWPRGGYDPVDETNRAGLFDSLFHSAAIVGINTSAMIEAAIVGRPVLAIQAPEFAGTQEGTLHYRHLLPENGGFLRVSSSFAEHLSQLAGVLHDPQASRAQLDGFVRSFIRPCGRDIPATSVLADAIERYGRTPPRAPARGSMSTAVLRALLWPLAWGGRLWLSPSARKQASRVGQKAAKAGTVRVEVK
jgi:ubiquinone biosynthesis protein UbiJ